MELVLSMLAGGLIGCLIGSGYVFIGFSFYISLFKSLPSDDMEKFIMRLFMIAWPVIAVVVIVQLIFISVTKIGSWIYLTAKKFAGRGKSNE